MTVLTDEKIKEVRDWILACTFGCEEKYICDLLDTLDDRDKRIKELEKTHTKIAIALGKLIMEDPEGREQYLKLIVEERDEKFKVMDEGHMSRIEGLKEKVKFYNGIIKDLQDSKNGTKG